MFDLTASQQLLIVNVCTIFVLIVFTVCTIDLICFFRKKQRCAALLRPVKSLITASFVLCNLAFVLFGVFAMGMSHSGGYEGYNVLLFIVVGLIPSMLFIVWIFTRLSISGLWIILAGILVSYIAFVNPAAYVRYWADDNYVWAQMWLAKKYETGGIGITQSNRRSVGWYEKAASNGSRKAQFRFALTRGDFVAARKWYLLAAEQGHVDAMIQAARLAYERQERLLWLNKAAEAGHPDAFFMLAEIATDSNLPQARKLLIKAADGASRSAIKFLIGQYRAGGILFDKNLASAAQWESILEQTPVSEIDSNRLTKALMSEPVSITKKKTDETEVLYKQALDFLDHPALDAELKARAIGNLEKAAALDHGDAAYKLARLAMKDANPETINAEALQWYQVAAATGHENALREVISYYKEKPEASIEDLEKSLEYNLQLYNILVTGERPKPFLRNHIAGEYQDTKEKIAQLKRLGGSWETAKLKAQENPDEEYRLGQELIDSGERKQGWVHILAAADKGSNIARFKVARRTLTQPRSFSTESNAITEIQLLDQLGYLPASNYLGYLYNSGNRVYPTNLYLARQLLQKAQRDPELAELAIRRLAKIPAYFENLDLEENGNHLESIDRWYKEVSTIAEDKDLLKQQYDTLVEHFRDTKELRRRAEEGDAGAQYQLAETLQNRNLSQSIHWLQKAAEGGNSNAQYDLARRMIYGKRNSIETKRKVIDLALSAANDNHVGAMIFTAYQLYKEGYGDLQQDTAKAREYCQRALASTEGEILYQARHTGQTMTITRKNIQRVLNKL